MRSVLLAIVLLTPISVYAQAIPPTGDTGDTAAPVDTHPVLSTDATWAGSMVIGIAGLFLAATVIGPMVDAQKEDELPAAADHDAGHHVHHH
jgi:hypothetical protein